MVVLDNNGRQLNGYTISSASKPNSSGELKNIRVFHLKITIFSFFSHEQLQDKFSVCHDVVVTVALP